MKRVLHPILLLAVLLAAMTGVVACGGGDEGGGGSGGGGGGGSTVSDDADPQEILDKAFSADQKIDSGVLSVNLKGSASGQGDGEVTISGPFENEGVAKLPKFDFDVSVTAAGQDIKAGIENTGSKAFVNYNDTEYVLDDSTYQQFKTNYERSAQQAQGGSGDQQTFADLGVDPASWLKAPSNEGDSDVEGTETVKVAGDVDVPKMLADVNTLIEKAGQSAAAATGDVPEKLTQEQIDQAEQAIKSLTLEVEGAKSDGSLRRVGLDIDAENPDGGGDAVNGTLDVTLAEVNEGQEFPEPDDAQPFQQLLQQFGGLGALGGLGGAGGGASSGSSGGSSAEQQEKLQQYSECIQQAGSDATKAQQCASVLG